MMMADKLFFLSMIIIPLLIMLSAGYSLKNEKLNIVPVAIADEDNSVSSRLLVKRLSQKDGIGIYEVSREEGIEMVENGEAEQLFIIKSGFEAAIKKGDSRGVIDVVSSPSSYSTNFTREVVSGESIRLVTAEMAANTVMEHYKELGIETDEAFKDEVSDFLDSLWEPEPLMTMEYRELKGSIITQEEHKGLPTASASSAGLIVAFIMFYMLFSSGWLLEERMNGTIKRLETANGALAVSFGASILSLFAAGSLQIIMFSAVLKLFFGITLFSGIMTYGVLMAYVLSVIAISLFLSAILGTMAQLQAGAPVLALFTGFLGGCFWNFMELPQEMQRLSLCTPQGWALKGINSLLTDPANKLAAVEPIVVLVTIALILLPLSYIIVVLQKNDGYIIPVKGKQSY
jgi:ABC-2 type transport system permease protein